LDQDGQPTQNYQVLKNFGNRSGHYR
jgi:hypothetical protein